MNINRRRGLPGSSESPLELGALACDSHVSIETVTDSLARTTPPVDSTAPNPDPPTSMPTSPSHMFHFVDALTRALLSGAQERARA